MDSLMRQNFSQRAKSDVRRVYPQPLLEKRPVTGRLEPQNALGGQLVDAILLATSFI